MDTNVLGELVTASAGDRTLEFRVLPYGETSAVMASGHRFAVDPGVVELPEDPAAAHVNEEHDRTRPVGRFTALEERQDGLYGRVELADTTAGRDALELATAGLRTGISVEIENPVIRAGRLLAGRLVAAALVVTPSFASARLAQASALPEAPDLGEISSALEQALAANRAAAEAVQAAQDALQAQGATQDSQGAAPDAQGQQSTATAAQREDTMNPTATAAAAALAAAAQAAAPTPTPRQILLALASAQAKLGLPATDTARAAALDQIVQADVFDEVNVPQYVGELWKGRRYAGRYLDLVDSATLTSQSVIGWRWIAGKTPTVARWTPSAAGTMNDVPTNEVAAESKTFNAFRIAGGHAVDRIHVDLPNQEWWNSYNLESTDDYARKLDAEVIAHVTDPANMTALTLAAGTSTESRILEGIGAAIEFCDPDFILLGWDLFRELALAKKFDNSNAMAQGAGTISFDAGQFGTTYLSLKVKAAPRSLVAQNGRVIVGSRHASVLHSLPGGPVRVDTAEIQNGTVQHGVFGYQLLRSTDPRGVIDVELGV